MCRLFVGEEVNEGVVGIGGLEEFGTDQVLIVLFLRLNCG